ncbi:MAG TPA: hypothetical protein PLS38_05000, partial [Solirubrobacterales bacterium]|nr:hypothetical protein [Solirubrobacterales bacterium]HNC05643.1 hypothetical protein [Solirubrobacterales bacterium]
MSGIVPAPDRQLSAFPSFPDNREELGWLAGPKKGIWSAEGIFLSGNEQLGVRDVKGSSGRSSGDVDLPARHPGIRFG